VNRITDNNTMANPNVKRQTMAYKALDRKLKIEQHGHHKTRMNTCFSDG